MSPLKNLVIFTLYMWSCSVTSHAFLYYSPKASGCKDRVHPLCIKWRGNGEQIFSKDISCAECRKTIKENYSSHLSGIILHVIYLILKISNFLSASQRRGNNVSGVSTSVLFQSFPLQIVLFSTDQHLNFSLINILKVNNGSNDSVTYFQVPSAPQSFLGFKCHCCHVSECSYCHKLTSH